MTAEGGRPATGTGEGSTPTARPAPGPTSRLRRLAPWVGLVLATALVAALLTAPRSGDLLDPHNPGPDGGMALARVLQQQGVQVDVVAGSTGLVDGEVQTGPGTTVLLVHTAYLGAEGGPELVASVAEADRLVVLVPDPGLDPGEALGVEVDVTWSGGGAVPPDCSDPVAREGDLLSSPDVLLSAGGEDRAQVMACYPPGAGHNAGGAREGAVLTFPATADRPTLTVAGTTSAWTNAVITEEANAALALRLLGGSERLVWVVPQPADAQLDAAASLWEVLPRYLTSWLWLLGAAVLALALWQGRRLGPVVTEPLPAVVHAVETTLSRGRLYRQARDRGHALEAARSGTRRRIAPRLGLPRSTPPERLAQAVADATGRPGPQVRDLLLERAAPDDAALLALLRELRDLEEQLRA